MWSVLPFRRPLGVGAIPLLAAALVAAPPPAAAQTSMALSIASGDAFFDGVGVGLAHRSHGDVLFSSVELSFASAHPAKRHRTSRARVGHPARLSCIELWDPWWGWQPGCIVGAWGPVWVPVGPVPSRYVHVPRHRSGWGFSIHFGRSHHAGWWDPWWDPWYGGAWARWHRPQPRFATIWVAPPPRIVHRPGVVAVPRGGVVSPGTGYKEDPGARAPTTRTAVPRTANGRAGATAAAPPPDIRTRAGRGSTGAETVPATREGTRTTTDRAAPTTRTAPETRRDPATRDRSGSDRDVRGAPLPTVIRGGSPATTRSGPPTTSGEGTPRTSRDDRPATSRAAPPASRTPPPGARTSPPSTSRSNPPSTSRSSPPSRARSAPPSRARSAPPRASSRGSSASRGSPPSASSRSGGSASRSSPPSASSRSGGGSASRSSPPAASRGGSAGPPSRSSPPARSGPPSRGRGGG